MRRLCRSGRHLGRDFGPHFRYNGDSKTAPGGATNTGLQGPRRSSKGTD